MSSFLLHLLRHGAPDTPGRLIGSTDVPATPAGIAACVEQAEGLPIDRLISSDLCRASAAATEISAMTGLPLALDPRWREVDFGDWEGRHPSEIDPETLGRFWRDPETAAPPGGERWSALTGRVGAAIDTLAPVPTLIVTHGGAMRAALAALCGYDTDRIWSIELGYAALLSLRVWPGETRTAQIIGLYP